jgi:hypothetical protein
VKSNGEAADVDPTLSLQGEEGRVPTQSAEGEFEMSDGLSDANRKPDYTIDPMFGTCNACQNPGCSFGCAVEQRDALLVELIAERKRTDELVEVVKTCPVSDRPMDRPTIKLIIEFLGEFSKPRRSLDSLSRLIESKEEGT